VGEGLNNEVGEEEANGEAVEEPVRCEPEGEEVSVNLAVLESTQLMEAVEVRHKDKVGDDVEAWLGVMEEVKE
jgi:hypothetical protein